MSWLRERVLTWRGLALGLIALLFWAWAYPLIARVVISPSWWLDVRSVYVEDSRDGVAPAVIVDRDINRSFTGSYRVALRRIEDGALWTYCVGERIDIEYRAGAPYPGRNLDWWLGHPPADQCRVSPGQYQLVITWTIPALPLVRLTTTNQTVTPFTVRDPIPPQAGAGR